MDKITRFPFASVLVISMMQWLQGKNSSGKEDRVRGGDMLGSPIRLYGLSDAFIGRRRIPTPTRAPPPPPPPLSASGSICPLNGLKTQDFGKYQS